MGVGCSDWSAGVEYAGVGVEFAVVAGSGGVWWGSCMWVGCRWLGGMRVVWI